MKKIDLSWVWVCDPWDDIGSWTGVCGGNWDMLVQLRYLDFFPPLLSAMELSVRVFVGFWPCLLFVVGLCMHMTFSGTQTRKEERRNVNIERDGSFTNCKKSRRRDKL